MTAMRYVVVLAFVGAMAVMVAGCAIEARPPGVSSDSEKVLSGRGELSYTAPRRGTVYVFDETTDKMIYSGRVIAGDKVRIDSSDGDIELNGKNAVENVVKAGRKYEVWFDAETR